MQAAESYHFIKDVQLKQSTFNDDPSFRQSWEELSMLGQIVLATILMEYL